MASQEFQDLISIDLKDNPNVLNQYDSVSYHFKLFMMNELTLKKNGYNIKNTPQRIISETGKSSIYINDVQIEHWVAPNHKTLSASGIKFTMTLIEPHGMSLLDQIYNSSVDLAIANYARSPMYMELSFLGRDEQTGEERKVYTGNANHLWRVQLINMETQVDAGGTTYILMGHLFNDLAVNETLGRPPMELEVYGNSFTEMLSNLEKAWNDAEQSNYDSNVQPLHQYKFYLYNNFESSSTNVLNWETLKFIPGAFKNQRTDQGKSTSTQGMTQANWTTKHSIQEILDTMISNTNWGEETGDILSSVSKENEKREPRFPRTYRIETRIEYTDFDPVSNDYNKEISYHIWPYDTITPILESLGANKDKKQLYTQAKATVDLLIKKRMIQKQYNYIFTGQNVDIINFDLRFNSMWQAYIPIYEGLYGSDQEEGSAKEPKRDPSDIVDLEKERRKWEKMADKFSDTDRYAEQISVKREKVQLALDSTLSEQRRIGQQTLTERRLKASNKAKEQFAEDLNPTDIKPPIVPVSTVQNRDVNNTHVNRGMETNFQKGQNLMAAFLNQVYNTRISEFIQIDLEIRGDPYWLGENHFKRQSDLGETERGGDNKPIVLVTKTTDSIRNQLNIKTRANTEEAPAYFIAEQLFLLTFKTPDLHRELSPSGTPVTKNSAVVNGLYQVHKVVNEFKEGRFTQKLTAKKEPYTSQYSLVALDKARNGADDASHAHTHHIENSANRTDGNDAVPASTSESIDDNNNPNATIAARVNVTDGSSI